MGLERWERPTQYRPIHNIISSDFSKFVPMKWKYLEGEPRMHLILAHEYQRMWIEEQKVWKRRSFPDKEHLKVDMVKRYITTFKTTHHPPRPEIKKPFVMKKFQNIKAKTHNTRPADDKAMGRLLNHKGNKHEHKEVAE